MPEPHVFQSYDEAISILSKYDKEIPKSNFSKEEVIRNSVSGNIFRAFTGLNKNPSLIYREWARENIERIINFLNKVDSKEDYEKELFYFFYSFVDYWDSQVESAYQRIIFGPASKMVNLLIKKLYESNYVENERILNFMNVPFDKFSLKPLKKIINEISSVKYKVKIQNEPTMKDVSSPDLYRIIQKAVFKMCEDSGISPILYDYWCWDDNH